MDQSSPTHADPPDEQREQRLRVRVPFERCINFAQEADELLRISIHAIARTTQMVPLVSALAALDSDAGDAEADEHRAAELASARADAAFAQRELDRDFPLLRAHTVLAMWGALEVLAKDVALTRLLIDPTLIGRSEFARIKVPIAEFELLDRTERMRAAVSLLERETNAPLQPGIGRFEALFQAVDLGGSVPRSVSDTLFEMSQVRNLIAHRGGTVDQKFAAACPHLNVTPGDEFSVTGARYAAYRNAVMEYLALVISRVANAFRSGDRTEVLPEGDSPER
jgi:hypothetical protein